MSDLISKLEYLRALVEREYQARILRDYPNFTPDMMTVETARLKMGRKYCNVDVGRSGKYMVELATGAIYGIKGYGVVHRGHYYGTLDTVDQYYWGEYRAVLKANYLSIRVSKA